MKNCTYVVRTVLLMMLIAAGSLSGFSQQIEKGLRASTGDWLGFLEYKPADYAKTTKKYPLIIFLHGIGERGNGTSDLKYVARIGLPRMIKLGHNMTFTWNGKTETFLVLSPQCPKNYGMWPNAFVEDLIKYAKTNLRIDEDRIYLTGLSMGGGGTFKYISTAASQPKNISAAATVCAPCTFKDAKYVVDANLPVWSFHALDDNVASASCTQSAIRKINALNPAVRALETYWASGGHGVWDRLYTDTNYRYNGIVNIYEWFLGQNRTWAVNKLPTARAGSDLTTTTGNATVTLNGSASSDPDGKIVRYVWKKISGPSAGVITDAFGSRSSTTVTGLTLAGTYKYALYVVDDRASYTGDTITVVVTSGASVANKAPIARAGVNKIITLPINSIKLDAGGSEDTDGSIASYAWTKASGPTAKIGSPSSAVTTMSNLVEGTYSFKLVVTDNKGATGIDFVTVVVNPAPIALNKAPIANAGNNITLTLPDNRTVLNGSASSDPDGTIATYEWSKLSGPSQFIIADASVKSTNLTNLSEGTYRFILVVTDNDGATDEDTVTVKVNAALPVPNVAPYAEAGSNKVITLPNDEVTLDASNSSDPDGTIQSYHWSYVSGPGSYSITSPALVSTKVTGLQAGTYSFRIEVKDNDGDIDADTVKVDVREADVPPPPPNKKPIAIAGTDITIMLPLNEVTLDGSRSEDEDGTLTNYSWMMIDGPSQFSIVSPSYHITKVENLVQGTYRFRLQVKDTEGALGYDTIVVNVQKAPNEVPTSKAGANGQIQLPVNEVDLSGKDSYDPDGTIVKYYWEYVTGPAGAKISDASSADITITQLKEGEYKFRLTVTDNEGTKASDVVLITVLPEPPNQVPVAVAGEDIAVQLPNPGIKLDGSGSYDVDGTITGYSWVKVSGPNGVTITNAATASPTIIGLAPGTYVFRLTVTDNSGNIASNVIEVTVNAAPAVAPEIPVAAAGADQTIAYPETTTYLDGSNSGTDVSDYEWRQISGPSSANITSPGAAITQVSGLETGEYYFELNITDNNGRVTRDTVSISIVNTMRYEEGLVLYPNPARTTVNAELVSDTLGTTRITIYNASGMVVHSHNTMKTQTRLFERIGVDRLQTGMYYLEVIVDGKQRKLTKFVKN